MTEKTTVKSVIAVYETTDYDMFEKIIGNRPIYQPQLLRLIKSIQKRNLLPKKPGLAGLANPLTGKRKLGDGQHRLLAAKALGLPFYFTEDESVDINDVQLLNANSRSWTTEDYLSSYIEIGKENYVVLKDFAEQYNISVPIAMVILADAYTHRQAILQNFRDGKFTIKDFEKAENMVSLLVEVRRYCADGAWTDRNLMQALTPIYQKGFGQMLLKRLKDYSLLVSRRHSVREYLKEFEDILNYNQIGKLIELF